MFEKIEYDLPPSAIAQNPVTPRDSAKLLVINRGAGDLVFSTVNQLCSFLEPEDLLVLNDSKVIPARLRCTDAHGKDTALLVLRFDDSAGWLEALVPGAKKINCGDEFLASEGLKLEVVEKKEGGTIRFRVQNRMSWLEYLARCGEAPLPPYIKREKVNLVLRNSDLERYQTVYAGKPGSIAAPTAGLHFTPELLEKISVHCQTGTITLHVGEATFRGYAGGPPGVEAFSISNKAVKLVKNASRVVAVGTTVCRVLEHMARLGGIKEGSGCTDIVLTPGCDFLATGALMTNFHMPSSSPLALAAAFCGKQVLLDAYRMALENNFRFASYGDSMLIV